MFQTLPGGITFVLGGAIHPGRYSQLLPRQRTTRSEQNFVSGIAQALEPGWGSGSVTKSTVRKGVRPRGTGLLGKCTLRTLANAAEVS